MTSPLRLYLDQNYLSGIAKRKPAFCELEPVLRQAVDRGAVEVLESVVHEEESLPRPDLRLPELLHGLSGGRRLPAEPGRAGREARRRMAWTIEHEFPERPGRASDVADLDALAGALIHCDLIACDAFMADVVRRARLDLRYRCEHLMRRDPQMDARADPSSQPLASQKHLQCRGFGEGEPCHVHNRVCLANRDAREMPIIQRQR